MTLVMLAIKLILPSNEKYPLPPEIITSKLRKKFPLGPHHETFSHKALTLAIHFAFGAAAGVVYALISRPVKIPAVLKGSIHGLGVWGTNYLWFLPALGLYQPATRAPGCRNFLMIFAHLVWGSTLGLIFEWLEKN